MTTTINRDTVTLTELRSSQDPFAQMDAKNLGDGQIEVYKGNRGLLSGTKLEKMLMKMGFYKDTRIAQNNAKIVLKDALINEHSDDFQERMFKKFNINVNSLDGNTVSRQLMDAIAKQAALEKGVNPRVAPYVQQQRQQLNEAQEQQYQQDLANKQDGDRLVKPSKDTLLKKVMLGIAPPEHADPKLEKDFRRYANGIGQIKEANLDFLREVHAFDQMDKNDPARVAKFKDILNTYVDEVNTSQLNKRELNEINQKIQASPHNAANLIGDAPFEGAASRVENAISSRTGDYIQANDEVAEKEKPVMERNNAFMQKQAQMWNKWYQTQLEYGTIRPPQQARPQVQPLQQPNLAGAQHNSVAVGGQGNIDPMRNVEHPRKIPNVIHDYGQTSHYGDAGIESGDDIRTGDEMYDHRDKQRFMSAQQEGGITGFDGEFHGKKPVINLQQHPVHTLNLDDVENDDNEDDNPIEMKDIREHMETIDIDGEDELLNDMEEVFDGDVVTIGGDDDNDDARSVDMNVALPQHATDGGTSTTQGDGYDGNTIRDQPLNSPEPQEIPPQKQFIKDQEGALPETTGTAGIAPIQIDDDD